MVMQLHEKQLVPSLNFRDPNPSIDWQRTPFRVNTELREWPADPDGARRAGVSAFGFGGTNFHAVLEEHVPGLHRSPHSARSFASAEIPSGVVSAAVGAATVSSRRPEPLRGALVLGGSDDADVVAQLEAAASEAAAGRVPPSTAPDPALASAAVRVAIDYADAADLAAKIAKAVKAFGSGSAAAWKILRAQGVFVGRGPAPKVAFLYTGPGIAVRQHAADPARPGSGGRRDLRGGGPDHDAPARAAALVVHLRRRERPGRRRGGAAPADPHRDHPAGGAHHRPRADPAARGLRCAPGHGDGPQPRRVRRAGGGRCPRLRGSARGRERARAARWPHSRWRTTAPWRRSSPRSRRSSGSSARSTATSSSPTSTAPARRSSAERPRRSSARFGPSPTEGTNAVRLPVSHAFHTSIVAPASEPLKTALRRLDLRAPALPVVSNVTGDFYPAQADTETMLDLLGRQVASPVQFVRGLHTLYDAGARVFVEVGPRKALHGFVEDVLGGQDDVLALFTNHPKNGDLASFNAAMCGLWAAGLGYDTAPRPRHVRRRCRRHGVASGRRRADGHAPRGRCPTPRPSSESMSDDQYVELGHVFADALERGLQVYGHGHPEPDRHRLSSRWSSPVRRWGCPAWPTSSTTRTCSGSSTASSSSTPFRTTSVSRWSTCTSPGWSSESRVTPPSRPSTTRPTSSSWRDGTRRSTSSSSSVSTPRATPRSTR